jgi:hypothetical protein
MMSLPISMPVTVSPMARAVFTRRWIEVGRKCQEALDKGCLDS